MILVDTSAWVEYDRATGSPVDRRLTQLITDEGPIAVTEPVVMELAAAAWTDQREMDLRRFLLRFVLLTFDSVVDFDAAANIFGTCRRLGITPRGMMDCMIAGVALRYGATLLAFDVDMKRVADVVGIRLDPGAQVG
ncbi:MAG TPA: PIN domain nuclease [Acidimicrobiales bacterium]